MLVERVVTGAMVANEKYIERRYIWREMGAQNGISKSIRI